MARLLVKRVWLSIVQVSRPLCMSSRLNMTSRWTLVVCLLVWISHSPIAMAETLDEAPAETQTALVSAPLESAGGPFPIGLSLAYATENIVRPGFVIGVDLVVAELRAHRFVVSPQLGFSRFAPFSVSLRPGVQAMYRLKTPWAFGFRPIAITAQYNHTFLTRPVYEVRADRVQRARDMGYGRVRVIGTTGMDVDLSSLTSQPVTVFVDGGVSAEPYFGVARFHLEVFGGLTWWFR